MQPVLFPLNKEIICTAHSVEPFPYWVFDHACDARLIAALRREWPLPTDHRWEMNPPIYMQSNGWVNRVAQHGILEISMPQHMPSLMRYFDDVVHSHEFAASIRELLGVMDIVPDSYREWSGMCTRKPGSVELIHRDARRCQQLGLHKELSFHLFVHQPVSTYDLGDRMYEDLGGHFELWDDSMLRKVASIPPKSNRLVVFQNTETSYHGTPTVNAYMPIYEWSMLKRSSHTNCERKVFVARPEDMV